MSPQLQNGMDAARAAVVNRTHRVVREQALEMRQQRQKERSLWVPLSICSVMLVVVCYAIWVVLDGYELMPNGVPDASDQIIILMLWSLPISALVLGLWWFRNSRGRMGNGEVQ